MSTYEVTVRFRVEAESMEQANRAMQRVFTASVIEAYFIAIQGYQIEDTETHEIGEVTVCPDCLSELDESGACADDTCQRYGTVQTGHENGNQPKERA